MAAKTSVTIYLRDDADYDNVAITYQLDLVTITLGVGVAVVAIPDAPGAGPETVAAKVERLLNRLRLQLNAQVVNWKEDEA